MVRSFGRQFRWLFALAFGIALVLGLVLGAEPQESLAVTETTVSTQDKTDLNITAQPKSGIVYDGKILDRTDFTFGGTDKSLLNEDSTTVTVEGYYVCNTGGKNVKLESGDYVLPGATYRKIDGTYCWLNGSKAAVGYNCTVQDDGSIVVGGETLYDAPSSGCTYMAVARKKNSNSDQKFTSFQEVKISRIEKYDLTSAGTHIANITIDAGENYNPLTLCVKDVVIAKAPLTVKAMDQLIHKDDEVPDLSNPVLGTHYTVAGLVGDDELGTAPKLAYQKDGQSVAPDNTKAGTYDIVPSGASAGDNYSVTYENGTLTVSDKTEQTITAADVTIRTRP